MLLAGVIDSGGDLATKIDTVLKTSVLSLMCTFFVIVTGFKSKRVGPTVVAVIGAAIVWWAVMDITVLRDQVGDDADEVFKSAPPAVVSLETVPDGAR